MMSRNIVSRKGSFPAFSRFLLSAAGASSRVTPTFLQFKAASKSQVAPSSSVLSLKVLLLIVVELSPSLACRVRKG